MRFRPTRVTLLSVVVGALLGFATCRVNLGDDLKYSCTTDADCAGGGYKCAFLGASGSCCLPSGVEICDKIDNDCDGVVDNTGKIETCNGLDDDCNGQVDETFHLETDPLNCGTCGHTCTSRELCIQKTCTLRLETECFDGLDNDNNTKIDCDDPSCDQQSCGAACVCKGLKKTEAACSDALDNDGDTLKDCLDPDCAGQACGAGCTCAMDGGTKTETLCTDGVDNDGDLKVDCDDPDCVGQLCTPPQLFFTCTASMQCKCNGGVQVSEANSLLCRDGIDNDCNGKADCAEATCNGQSCSADGGSACNCSGGLKKEMSCANLLDDDGDGHIDCADDDCPMSTPCNKGGGDAGTCSASKTCL